MATNDKRSNTDRTRSHKANRDRKRDRLVEGVKNRPYTTAAVATLAAGAGAAAFLLTRSKSDKPLINWGQSSDSERQSGTQAGRTQGSTSSSSTLETSSASPSSSAGMSAGTGASSASSIAKDIGAGSQSATSRTPAQAGADLAKGGTGLDQTAEDQTKTGAIAYGA